MVPDANHGAGIFTKLGHKNGINVRIHVPAPWFASGFGRVILAKKDARDEKRQEDGVNSHK